MSDDTTKALKSKPAKPKASNIVEFTPPKSIDYDVEELSEFLDFVFTGAFLDENILCWNVKTGGFPAYPEARPKFLTGLEKKH